jgi:hypothetical protein
MGGFQERLVIGVRRFGDRLLEAHVAFDGVSMLGEHGIGQQAGHSPVAVLKGVDDENGVLAAGAGLKRTVAPPSGERSTTRLSSVLNAPPGMAV